VASLLPTFLSVHTFLPYLLAITAITTIITTTTTAAGTITTAAGTITTTKEL
jgi:hypothetical protein